MSAILYPLYTFLHVALLIWGIVLWRRTRQLSTFIITLVSLGLVYDNLILSIGIWLESGKLLYFLSLPRFVLHQLVLPWLMYTAFIQTHRTGRQWPKHMTRWVFVLVIIITVLGILTRVVPMNLVATKMDGVTRYLNKGTVGPPLVSIVSIGFTAVMGFLLWRKNRWPWVFLTAVMVFVGEGIPVEMVRRVVGSGAEVLFIVAILVTERWLETLTLEKTQLP